MQESCPYGSVRGAPSKGCPYRNRPASAKKAMTHLGEHRFDLGELAGFAPRMRRLCPGWASAACCGVYAMPRLPGPGRLAQPTRTSLASDYPDKAAKPCIHHTLSSFAGMLGGFAP
jgi:hypothetical protein